MGPSSHFALLGFLSFAGLPACAGAHASSEDGRPPHAQAPAPQRELAESTTPTPRKDAWADSTPGPHPRAVWGARPTFKKAVRVEVLINAEDSPVRPGSGWVWPDAEDAAPVLRVYLDLGCGLKNLTLSVNAWKTVLTAPPWRAVIPLEALNASGAASSSFSYESKCGSAGGFIALE